MVSGKVSTKKGKQLHNYEMVLIVSPEVVDENLEAALGNVSNLITGTGGIIAEIEQWGKRKLAYPIEHMLEGHYVLAKFQMPPGAGKELEASLQISKDILRYLLIKLDS